MSKLYKNLIHGFIIRRIQLKDIMSGNDNWSSPSSPGHNKELTREELAHRISDLKTKIKNAKKRTRDEKTIDNEEARQAVLKKSHEGVEKQFQMMMENFKIRGFVYSFRDEKGAVVSGASESLNNWWGEKLNPHLQDAESTASNIDFSDSSAIDQNLPDHSG
jgi:Ethylene insensitive 3